MKKSISIILLTFLLTSCGDGTPSDKFSNCPCYDKTYTNIDSALKCGADPTDYKSLLFVLVSSDLEKNKALGWDILKDKDIINAAKRDYVLIIIDPSTIILPDKSDAKEFLDIIKQERKEPYFVVTNRVFYPFREFTLQTDKDKIINDLNLGEGP